MYAKYVVNWNASVDSRIFSWKNNLDPLMYSRFHKLRIALRTWSVYRVIRKYPFYVSEGEFIYRDE